MVARVNTPLVVIVGETASGKSALALEVAQMLGGEIICADARTIYRGMDIGTAKPSREERALVPHHLLDVVEPDEQFSVAQFKRRAEAAIADITARGKLPVMVGGTGLYVDSVLYNFSFRSPADPDLREELNKLSVSELQNRLAEQGIPLPENAQNPRHLIRALETGGVVSGKGPIREHAVVTGLQRGRDGLVERINRRVDAMVAAGLEDEVKQLVERFGWNAPGLMTIGYREWRPYFASEQTFEQTVERIKIATRQYAKRQRTWFRRNESIRWFEDINKALAFIESKV